MNDVSADEAQHMLANAAYCDGCTSWAAGDKPGGKLIVAGLLDANGNRNGLFVKLSCLAGQAKTQSYLFSVYRMGMDGIDRVYQLAIAQRARRARHVHQLSHEHFGLARTIGTPEWETWSYAEALAYFSLRTNISFRPVPPDPWASRRKK